LVDAHLFREPDVDIILLSKLEMTLRWFINAADLQNQHEMRIRPKYNYAAVGLLNLKCHFNKTTSCRMLNNIVHILSSGKYCQ